ncbi:MAG: ACP phosphodiesterase [Xanthomonadales bacterium]|nr:ACP phosphodiesterase [Xanthomonadales bacterium]
MNYLAHAVLSGPDPLWQLGGYLGDHVRGSRWLDYPRAVGLGIRLHRKIDSFADRHPATADSRCRMDPGYRRYAGIMLDVFNDHFLAGSFEVLTGLDLNAFARHCDHLLDQHWALLPDSLRRFARYQKESDVLRRYADREFLDQVFGGIASRLSRPGPLASARRELDRLESNLEQNFRELYPDLTRFAQATRLELS